MFLIVMVIGLTGLAMMAVPAFARHGGVGRLHAGHAGHAGHLGAPRLSAGMSQDASTSLTVIAKPHDAGGITRFIPSPRAVFSVLALFGAFANALVGAVGLVPALAALVAVVPAVAVERFVVTPVWRLVFRFQGEPSSALEACIMAEAKAVTGFRNGRGIVAVVRDGRLVQFSARLVDAQAQLPVRVGDRLRVEDVDAKRERLTVSLLEG